MIPDLSSVLNGWTEPTEMRIIKKSVVNFELAETATSVDSCEMLLTPMSGQAIDRKPEGARDWMWWTALSTSRLNLDDEVQDSDNRIFRVAKRVDWKKAGFYSYDLVEAPGA